MTFAQARGGVCLLVFAASTALAGGAPASGTASPGSAPTMPFSFVENRGQADPEIRYIGNGPQFKAWFRDTGVTLQHGSAVTTVRFEGGHPGPRIDAGDPTGAKASYLRGSDTARWQTNLPLFGSIHYRGVWDGIEIRFKAEDSRTKAEYVVDPGASLEAIRIRFDGTTQIQSDGSLVVKNASGEFREDSPFLFQEDGGGRKEVRGGFRMFGDGTIGFHAESYDRRKTLVVDPTILFSGYFGGSSQSTITGVAVNSYYNIIVAGWTIGTDLPASGGAKPHNAGGVDAFVAGFSPAGGALLFCTYLGGSSDDRAFGVAVDSSNNTYVTGQTSSTNFPVVGGVQSKLKGARDAFVAKLNPAGSALLYSTYLGGSGADVGNAIVVDSTNAAIIIGDTNSTNLPVTAGAFQTSLGGGQDVFVAKLSPAGSALTWLTYFGGSATDHGACLTRDASGYVIFAGSTSSPNLPVLQAFQPRLAGGQDGFVTKLVPNGNSIIFSTYIGGSGGSPGSPEVVNGVSVGGAGSGSIVVAGTTSSPDFPLLRPLQPVYGGGQTDGFYSRFQPANGSLQFSTFLGGSGDDGINALVVDAASWLYVAGYSSSLDFPGLQAVQGVNAGGMDAFVAKVTFTKLSFATYLGGSGNDSANAIAIDSLTNIVVAGSTGSGNLPVSGGVGTWGGAGLTSFVTKFASNFTLGVANAPAFYLDVWHNTGYNGPNSSTLNVASFGMTGDIPVAGDWTGSGRKCIGVFRGGTWILDTNGNGVLDAADKTVAFGQSGDIPVVGDWNGTGRIKLGLFRQGSFILDLSGHLSGIATGVSDIIFPFGAADDIPVVADWNLSGTTKVGVFRSGQWIIDYDGDRAFNPALDRIYSYGQAGDLPVVGDWSSAGANSYLGVYRHGLWILNTLGNNQIAGTGQFELTLAFGGSNYSPLVF